MTNIEWLLAGDPVIVHLAKKYLLDMKTNAEERGYIKRYLKLYDSGTKQWGSGFYGPKWVSTNYTLLELKYMEINSDHPVYQESLINYVQHFFAHSLDRDGIETLDLCIAGMLIELLSYGQIHDAQLDALIDYVLDHRMTDGAWNCRWNRRPKPRISSVHTTINVLEGLQEYANQHYTYRLSDVNTAIDLAIKTLLERDLLFVKGTQQPIHASFITHHFPPRWKYDYLRILEFLAKKEYPLVKEMEPALDILLQHLKKGKLTKGTTITGRLHFPLEEGRFGRFNTLRAYIVLKAYAPEKLQMAMNQAYS